MTTAAGDPRRRMLPLGAMALFIDSLGIGITLPVAPVLDNRGAAAARRPLTKAVRPAGCPAGRLQTCVERLVYFFLGAAAFAFGAAAVAGLAAAGAVPALRLARAGSFGRVLPNDPW